MAVQKQTLPSFASVISVLSIVLYCAGFLRVELELNEQKKRINALENAAATAESPPSNPNRELKLTKTVPGKILVMFITTTKIKINVL